MELFERTDTVIYTAIYFLNFINPSFSKTLQVFQLYSEKQNESFTRNYDNLDKVENLARQSLTDFICSQRGAWIAFNSPDFIDDTRLPISKDSILLSCDHLPANIKLYPEFKRLVTSTSKLKSIRHIGHADLESPALSLYEFKHFGGAELYFDGINLQLPLPLPIQSYGFTGSENWTLYSTTDYSGSPICLDGQNTKNVIIDTVTVEGTILINSFYKVGRIHRGCSRFPARISGYGSEEDSLTLHTTMANRNKATLFMDGLELRLPSAQSFASFSIMGSQPWTIFEGTELNGYNHCLRPQSHDLLLTEDQKSQENYLKLRNIYNRTRNANREHLFHERVMIGSIKRGCSVVYLQRYRYTVFSSQSNLVFQYQRRLVFGILLTTFWNWWIATEF